MLVLTEQQQQKTQNCIYCQSTKVVLGPQKIPAKLSILCT